MTGIRKMMMGMGGAPWYLAGGLIPKSNTYTVYDPLAAPDLSSSLINLANPGVRNAIPGVNPTLSNGWLFNGTTQYLDSQKIFGANDTVVIWCEDVTGVYIAGNTKLLIRPLNDPNTRLTTSANTDLTGISTSAILGMSAGLPAYRNGKAGAAMAAWAAGTDYNMFIGCRNNAGVAANFAGGKVLRYAHYDFKLSDAQQIALFNTMRSYQLPAVDPYSSKVLALTPICYYPLNQKFGGYVLDISGNGAHAVSRYVTPGATGGLYGNSFQGAGVGKQIESLDNWATLTGINLNEFSMSCWVKNINADAQARPLNMYSNAGLEYFACEIRTGQIALYCKENSLLQNSAGVAATNNTWQQLVVYNSLSTGKYGIYLDGVKTEFTKTLTGFVDTSPDLAMPYNLQSMTGAMKHIAYYNRALNQTEVNSLL